MTESLDTVLMRMLLSSDNAWETLEEIESKVAQYRDWMVRLAQRGEAFTNE